MRKYAFEIVMAGSVIAGVIVLAATARSQAPVDLNQWNTDAGFTVGRYDSSAWIVQAVGPSYNPIYVRDDRRVYLVADDGGVRRCR